MSVERNPLAEKKRQDLKPWRSCILGSVTNDKSAVRVATSNAAREGRSNGNADDRFATNTSCELAPLPLHVPS
jgi:hypothetical protein